MDQHTAGQALDQLAEKVLQTQFFGDRSHYAEALSVASKRMPGAAEAYATDHIDSVWASEGDAESFSLPARGQALANVTDHILNKKFGGDKSRYVEALSLARKEAPELFMVYGTGQPGLVPDPPYTRQLPSNLEAKAQIDPRAYQTPPAGTIGNPIGYAPRGLQSAKVAKMAAKVAKTALKARKIIKAAMKAGANGKAKGGGKKGKGGKAGKYKAGKY